MRTASDSRSTPTSARVATCSPTPTGSGASSTGTALRLRVDVLEDRSRTFNGAVRARERRQQPVTGSLHRTLDRLESALAARH